MNALFCRTRRWSVLILLCLGALGLNVHATAGGAYASYAYPSPTLYAKNYVYQAPIPILGSPSGAVSSVRYTWSLLTYRPSGFEAYLCYGRNLSEARCLNVTNFESSSTNAFAGFDPKVPFFLAFRVVGSGSMAPVSTGQLQVIVNYQ